jgi:enoyl-CoA hydratase
MSELIRVESERRVRTLTIDRAEAKNALTAAMRDRIADLLNEADEADDVDVIVLAAVDPVFCSGVDLKDVLAGGRQAPDKPDPGAALRGTAKPTICAVNGACVTGGLEVALSCDMIVASDRARFADTHAKLGLLPAFGLSALLPRAVGIRKAREMSATGRFIDADEALRFGLVNHVVPHAELPEITCALAEDITKAVAPAVRATLDLYRRGAGVDLETALALEAEAFASWTPDMAAANARRAEARRERRKEG